MYCSSMVRLSKKTTRIVSLGRGNHILEILTPQAGGPKTDVQLNGLFRISSRGGCLPGPPERRVVGFGELDPSAVRRPPARGLGVDPDVLVAPPQGQANDLLEDGRRDVVLRRVVGVPALRPPVVIEPESEPGGDDLPVLLGVGDDGEDAAGDE